LAADKKAFKDAQEVLAPDTELKVDRQLDPEETMLVSDPEDLPAGDETIVVKEGQDPEPWRPTHVIGNYVVMEKQFATGLNYWVEEDGKRRRPTADKVLRKYIPPPADAKPMWFSRTQFALLCSALLDDEQRAEDFYGNVAVRVDEQHVKLSLRNSEGGHHHYLIQVPQEIEVQGAEI
jgi:hypothetical protein